MLRSSARRPARAACSRGPPKRSPRRRRRPQARATAAAASSLHAAILHRRRVRDGRCARRHDHPEGRASGSASDAGTAEFIDYIVAEQPERQTAMRGGSGGSTPSAGAFDKAFLAMRASERTQVLDDIAWPRKARPEMSPASVLHDPARSGRRGFLLEQGGRRRPRLQGNRPAVWNGPPPEVLAKLGISQIKSSHGAHGEDENTGSPQKKILKWLRRILNNSLNSSCYKVYIVEMGGKMERKVGKSWLRDLIKRRSVVKKRGGVNIREGGR